MCVIILLFALLALIVYPPLILTAVAAGVGWGIGYAIGSAQKGDKDQASFYAIMGSVVAAAIAILGMVCYLFGTIGIVPGLILIALIVTIIYNM